jgi:hypothetical protein
MLRGCIWQVREASGCTYKHKMHHTVCKSFISMWMWPYSSKCRPDSTIPQYNVYGVVCNKKSNSMLCDCFQHCLGSYDRSGEPLVAHPNPKCISLSAYNLCIWGYITLNPSLMQMQHSLNGKWCHVKG